MPKKELKQEDEEFVRLMRKKAELSESAPKPFTVLQPAQPDQKTESYLYKPSEKDMEAAEKHVKSVKDKIKA